MIEICSVLTGRGCWRMWYTIYENRPHRRHFTVHCLQWSIPFLTEYICILSVEMGILWLPIPVMKAESRSLTSVRYLSHQDVTGYTVTSWWGRYRTGASLCLHYRYWVQGIDAYTYVRTLKMVLGNKFWGNKETMSFTLRENMGVGRVSSFCKQGTMVMKILMTPAQWFWGVGEQWNIFQGNKGTKVKKKWGE